MPDKVVSGTIVDLAFKYSAKGDEYCEVSIQQPELKYPTKAKCFDSELVQRFHEAKKGMVTGLEIDEKQSEYQGKPITYRNIVGITKAQPNEAPEPKPNGAKPSTGYQKDTESIQRQVIFKEAMQGARQMVGTPLEYSPELASQLVAVSEYLFSEYLRIYKDTEPAPIPQAEEQS